MYLINKINLSITYASCNLKRTDSIFLANSKTGTHLVIQQTAWDVQGAGELVIKARQGLHYHGTWRFGKKAEKIAESGKYYAKK